MISGGYFSQAGGLPLQTLSRKAVFTTAYAVIPKTVIFHEAKSTTARGTWAIGAFKTTSLVMKYCWLALETL